MNKKLAAAIMVLALGMTACASTQSKMQKARGKDPRYQYNVGLFYLNQNNLDEAIKYFVKSLALDSTYHLAWNSLGIAHSLKGNLQESAKAFEKCLELNPGFSEARNNLGTIYQELNLLDKAEAEFRQAASDRNYPNKELPFYNLARLYYIRDKLEAAYDSVLNAIQLQPRLAMAHNLKGLILERWNRLPEAIAAYEEAVKVVPEDVLFNYNLAAARFKNNDYDKAREIFLRISPKVTDPEMREKVAAFLKMIDAIK